jgi:hypothetical protein
MAPVLRLGSTRAVLLVGPLAFKFARHKEGARCNLREAGTYRCATAQRRTLLCPIIWCSDNGAVLVQPALRNLTQDEIDHLKSTREPGILGAALKQSKR